MKSLERFLQTTLARPNGILPGIVRPIRQPQCENVTPDILSQLDRITNMLCRRLTNRRIDIAKAPQAVFLILKKVRIDRAQLHADRALAKATISDGGFPSSKSQRTCVATLGHEPVTR